MKKIMSPTVCKMSWKTGQFKRVLLVIILATYIILCSALILLMINRELRLRQDADSLEFQDYTEKSKESQSEVTNQNECETIHLASVCGGYNSTRSFYILLKSILFYRTDVKIHLHLFVDNISLTILTELFRTWHVPALEVSYYNMTTYESDISWIASTHYSHRYGLMKLIVPSVLSNKGLEKVILLDTDMIAMGNIKYLWQQMRRLDDSDAFLGLVENQSDWYMKQSAATQFKPIIWPARGRGFNTGLILIHLIKLKQNNWDKMWRQVAETELIVQLSTTLADQDIYNAVIKKHSWIVIGLECNLNMQVNDNNQLKRTCPYRQDRGFNIIHWNSPRKLETHSDMSDYFASWYKVFRDWNGGLLERDSCPWLENDLNSQQSNVRADYPLLCKDIRPAPGQRVRTYLYAKDFEIDNDYNDITAVVHLSLDRLHALDELALHWPGPVSAAIYLSESDTGLLLDSIQDSDNLSRRKNIAFHMVFKDYGFNYPINRMRNIALNNTVTPYVFLLDVDFLPSKNIYPQLRSTIDELKRFDNDQLAKTAIVVPAFENSQYRFDFPENKTKLEEQLDLGLVFKFRDQIWPQGQAPTNYNKWRVATRPYTVNWKPDYEPFIVTSRNVARFDERFVGFGWNKVEHTTQLAAQGYEFIVLPDVFIIHRFHPASYDIIKHRESPNYRACLRKLKENFLNEIKLHYPTFYKNNSSPTAK